MHRRLFSVVATVLSLTAGSLGATIDWKGFTWTLRGDTSAVVNLDGSLTLTTTGSSSGDPGNDNWVATASMPSSTQWMRFSFIDSEGGAGFGPRAYASSSNFNGVGEILLQGGVYSGYPNYWTNYSAWVDSAWKNTNWAGFGSPRQAGSHHSVLMGNFADNKTRIVYDGIVRNTSDGSDPNSALYYRPNFFNRAYLGMTGSPGETFSVTYTDFDTGVDPVPEPFTLGLAGAALAAAIRSRKTRKG